VSCPHRRSCRASSAVTPLESWRLPSENGRVITVTEPQVWVLIGVFSAAIFGMIGIVTTSFNRTLTASIGGLREAMNAKFEAIDARFEAIDARFEAIDAKFEAVDAKFEAIDARFDALSVKLEAMDRDIQALSRHIFGADSR
jgi:peptidoglycan hydrolase CwlO-like protein